MDVNNQTKHSIDIAGKLGDEMVPLVLPRQNIVYLAAILNKHLHISVIWIFAISSIQIVGASAENFGGCDANLLKCIRKSGVRTVSFRT